MRSLATICGLILAFSITCKGQVLMVNTAINPQGSDCSAIKDKFPNATSGVYLIQLNGTNATMEVYCEMRPEGGWMVFQRRTGPHLDFFKDWQAYKYGFGSLSDDHWLGLENVWKVTENSSRSWDLRVELWDHDGNSALAEYANFSLGSESMAYRLQVGNYSGDAGDAFRHKQHQTGSGFSTFDIDNDGCLPCHIGPLTVWQCSLSKGGGWWFSSCGSANLNGLWNPPGQHMNQPSGLHWITWKGPEVYSMNATLMMIRAV